jgi:hypothetical protein
MDGWERRDVVFFSVVFCYCCGFVACLAAAGLSPRLLGRRVKGGLDHLSGLAMEGVRRVYSPWVFLTSVDGLAHFDALRGETKINAAVDGLADANRVERGRQLGGGWMTGWTDQDHS